MKIACDEALSVFVTNPQAPFREEAPLLYAIYQVWMRIKKAGIPVILSLEVYYGPYLLTPHQKSGTGTYHVFS